jgi:hypothetical protein
MFCWTEYFLDRTIDYFNAGYGHSAYHTLDRIGDTLAGTHRTSAFSGVDTIGTAGNIIAHVIHHRLAEMSPSPGSSRPARTMKHLAAIDYDAACRTELSLQPEAPHCIFADINTFWAALVQTVLGVGSAPKQSGTTKKEALAFEKIMSIASDTRSTTCRSFCEVHRAQCEYPRGHLHEAGPPCVAWSPMGTHAKHDGPSMTAFAIWCGMRLKLQ